MLVTRQVILAKEEVTYNTDPTPTPAANSVLVENVALAFEGLRMAERTATRPSLGSLQKVYAGALMTLTFDAEIKGSGDVASDPVPEIGVLLLGCGFAATAVTNGVVYSPASTGHKSITIYVYQDGILFKLTGCRGTVTGNLAVGEVGKLSFTFSGHYAGPTDVALPAPTYDAVLPPPVVGASLQIGTFTTPVAAEVTFDMGLEVAKPTDISAADGFGEVQITKRAVTGTVNPEGVTVATADLYGELQGNDLLDIDTGWIGGTDEDIRYRVAFPKAQLTDVSQGDREGIRTFDLTFAAIETSADDEMSIAFGNNS